MIKGALEVTEEEAHNEFRAGGTIDCRIHDAKNATEQGGLYDHIRQIVRERDVWDIGGAAGIDWFRTGKVSRQWTVFELTETWYRYSRAMNQPGLTVKECKQDFADEAREILPRRPVLFAAGSIQYQETPLKFLFTNSRYCDYVIIKGVNSSNRTFITCQLNVGVCWFFKVEDIINALPGFSLMYPIGENTEHQYGADIPPQLKVYNLKNLFFKRT